MHTRLDLHPKSFCEALAQIEVEATRSRANQLELRFSASGDISSLRLPPARQPGYADELWRHTCFEAFLRAAGDSVYCEFNFSPSRQWAAYRFDAYRSGMQSLDNFPAPRLEVDANDRSCELTAVLDLNCLSAVGDWCLGLSAVVEEANGRLSYWALAHPPGKPDFHHPDCFALELSAPLST